MLQLQIENIGDMAVITCQGRLVRSDAAFKLRMAVLSQAHAHIIVVDLSDVTAVEGGGLGMLSYLNLWAHEHNIQLKLFSPTQPVRDRLEHASPAAHFDIAPMREMMDLLSQEEDAILAASTNMYRAA